LAHAARTPKNVKLALVHSILDSIKMHVNSLGLLSRRIMAKGHYLLGRPWGVGLRKLKKSRLQTAVTQ